MMVPIETLITTALSVAIGSIVATLIIWVISTYLIKRTLINIIDYLKEPIKNHLTSALNDKETREALLNISQHILNDPNIQELIKGKS